VIGKEQIRLVKQGEICGQLQFVNRALASLPDAHCIEPSRVVGAIELHRASGLR
jgi:hypothetical protein